MKIATAVKRPFWWDAVTASQTRASLDGDITVDVAIVGAGFTGLWTAYYLALNHPELEVAVVEATHVGYGASGRNGGWCHAEYPLGFGSLAKDFDTATALRHLRALADAVDEVGRAASAEGIDADYAKGGVLSMARIPFQVDAAEHEVSEAHDSGFTEDDIRFLDRDEATSMIGASGVLGGVWWAHGAAIQPAKLVHGLATAAERRGATIYEGTRVQSIEPGRLVADEGTVTARTVVRATEGYTSQFDGEARTIVPLYSLMIATEPLPHEIWDQIGLETRPTFSDFRNLLIYGQRTADGRLAFGGRGAPYHFRSSIKDEFDTPDAVHTELIRVLTELFPALGDFEITHRWGGPLGVPRDWKPSVTFDETTRMAYAGGYVGDGVATANLAGRTLADLVAGDDTDRTHLPWINHTWRKWEPEPFRWAGINFGLRLAKAADRSEERRQAPSVLAKIGNKLRGKP